MSLTSFLNVPDVRARFRREFPTVPFDRKTAPLMQAPPVTGNHSLVGTAFDYLLRFCIKRLNPGAHENEWIAEKAAADPGCFQRNCDWVWTGGDLVVDPRWKRDRKRAQAVVSQARGHYAAYLRNGRATERLLRSVLLLAQLDPLYRSVPKFSWREPDPADILDLRRLHSIVDQRLFKADRVCVLNPTFGEASRLVGGADADLVLDNAIIDIKTTKSLGVDRKRFNQLLGYYLLSQLDRIDGMSGRTRITRLGIYFSRHGYLWTFRVKQVVNGRRLFTLANWFVKRATQEFPGD